MEQVAGQRSGEVGGERTDAGLLAVKKLITAFLQEGGDLQQAVEQAMQRLAAAPSRERADYLLSLLGEPQIAQASGHPGIRRAAVRALLAFGYPYALEVPPEVIELARPKTPLWPRLRNWVAFLLGGAAWLFSFIANAWFCFFLVDDSIGTTWSAHPTFYAGLAFAGFDALAHLAWGGGTVGLLSSPLGSPRAKRNQWVLFGGTVGAVLAGVAAPPLMALPAAGVFAWALSTNGSDVRALD